MKLLRIGMVGLDTSHCEAFASILNNEEHPHHVPGGRVEVGFPGGSSDFELSASRVDNITERMRERFGITIADTIEEVAEASDAILLTSCDGRVHLEQFRKLASFGKPVFVDKPFAVRSDHAEEMLRLAEEQHVPLMSASSLRYSYELDAALSDEADGAVIGADAFGPMAIEETQGGLFWYGIHAAEMLYRMLGKGCVQVEAVATADHELVVGTWKDGRVGTIRGNRRGNNTFGAVLHRERGTRYIQADDRVKPGYAGLLEAAMSLFQEGLVTIDPLETLEIIRFLEAANESRRTGHAVKM